MTIYYVMFILLFIFSGIRTKKVTLGNIKTFNGENVYVMLAFLFLALVMGLRGMTVGCDVRIYYNRFLSSDIMFSWGRTATEWGYNYLNYLFHSILQWDFQALVFFISVLCIGSVCFVLNRYSDDFAVGLIIYITIGNFALNMSGLRQTIAISLVLYGLYFVEKKKPIYYGALVLIGSLCHSSAIIMLPFYFISKIKISRFQAAIVLAAAVSMSVLRFALIPIITLLAPAKYSGLDLMEGYNINFLVIAVPIVLCIFALFFMGVEEDHKFSRKNSFFYIFACCSIAFLFLSLSNNQLGRLSYYLNIGYSIITANALENMKRDNRRSYLLGKVLVIAFSLAYFAISTPGGTLHIDRYVFFWE